MESGLPKIDPRVRRTRLLLQDSLLKLLSQKDFGDISIQELADVATVNRATLYGHYPDKSALLHDTVEARFRQLMDRRGITFTCSAAIRIMGTAVCDFLATMPGLDRNPQTVSAQQIEAAMLSVLKSIILQGLAGHPPRSGLSPDVVAATVAWAIYGAAAAWHQSPGRPPAEDMGATIETLVAPIMHAAVDAP